MQSSGNPGKAVLDNVAKPVVLVPLRTIIFVVLFILIFIILSILIKATSVINKLPLIGQLNSLLGGVAGLLQGLVIAVSYTHLDVYKRQDLPLSALQQEQDSLQDLCVTGSE